MVGGGGGGGEEAEEELESFDCINTCDNPNCRFSSGPLNRFSLCILPLRQWIYLEQKSWQSSLTFSSSIRWIRSTWTAFVMKSSSSSSTVKNRFEEEEDFRLVDLIKLMISLSAVLASGLSGCVVHFSHFSKRIAKRGKRGCL